MRVDVTEPGSPGDRAHRTMRRASVQSLAVVAQKDRPTVRSPKARSIVRAVRGTRGITALVALAHDPQPPVAPLEAEVLDVGGARLAHPQSVQAQEHGEGAMGGIEALGGEQQGAELGAVESPGVRGSILGRRTY